MHTWKRTGIVSPGLSPSSGGAPGTKTGGGQPLAHYAAEHKGEPHTAQTRSRTLHHNQGRTV